MGGLIGIFTGRGLSLPVGGLMHWPAQASVTAAATVVAVSVTVGVAFAYYRAWKASQLDPIQTLRYE